MNIFAEFQRIAKNHADSECMQFKIGVDYSSLTYDSLYRHALGLRDVLQQMQVEPGDRVAIIAENHPGYVAAVLAILAARAVAVPLDIQYSIDQVESILMHSQAKVIVGSSRTFGQMDVAKVDISKLQVDAGDVLMRIQASSAHPPFQSLDQDTDPAIIFYTSGTTSAPKGVVLTHKNLLSNFHGIKHRGLVVSNDVVIAFLPLHHAYAFMATILTPLLSVAKIVFPPGISSIELIKCVRETRTTIFVGVPQVFSLMHKSIKTELKKVRGATKLCAAVAGDTGAALRSVTGVNLSKKVFNKIHQVYGEDLRLMVSGGAKLDPEVAKDFMYWGFTILTGYGLTETSPVVTFNPASQPKLGSVGKVLDGVVVKIDHPDAEGYGEVLVQGDNVMSEYYRDPNSTAAVIQDDWFRTGDIGRMDEDNYLFLKGRLKEMIVLSNGKNIYPEELERMYLDLPSIKDMAVMNVSGINAASEQLIGLIVIDDEFFAKQRDMGIIERIKWDLDNVSSKLPTYQRLKGYQIIKEELPRTRLGKLKRFQLDEIYLRAVKNDSQQVADESLESTTETGVPQNSSEIEQKALAYLSGRFKRTIEPSDHLELDLGVDSLGRIELLMDLQEHLGLKVGEDQAMEFFQCSTVDELKQALRSLSESKVQISPAEELEQRALQYLSERFKRPIQSSDHLELDLGLDSLGRIEMLMDLQEHLGMKVVDEDRAMYFFQCATIEDLKQALYKLTDQSSVSANQPDLEQRALEYLESKFKRSIQHSDHLELDLGVDSLGRIELLMNLQEHLSLQVDEDRAMDFFQCATVADLKTALDQLNTESVTKKGEDVSLKWGEVLQEAPQSKTIQSIRLSFDTLTIIFNVLVITVLKSIFGMLFLLSSDGRKHLPKEGAYIITPNHASFLDGLFVMCALPYKVILKTYFIGAGQFLEAGAIKPFSRNARLVPIYKDYSLLDTLRCCSHLLRNKKSLCYFPAGQRSIDGNVQEFKKGIGILAKELNVPVVPTYIQGSFNTWPRGQKWPKLARIKVIFGEPLDPSKYGQAQGQATDYDYQAIADQLRQKVAELKSSKK